MVGSGTGCGQTKDRYAGPEHIEPRHSQMLLHYLIIFCKIYSATQGINTEFITFPCKYEHGGGERMSGTLAWQLAWAENLHHKPLRTATMHVTHQKRAQHSWGQLHPQWLHLHALTCFQAKPCPSYTKGDTGGSHTGCAKPYSAQCGLQSLLYSHQTV